MCNCKKIRTLPEILSIAQRYAVTQQATVIVFKLNESFDFCVYEWYLNNRIQGAEAKFKVETDGTYFKI